MLDSVIRVKKNHYLQTLLEECKYVIRKNKMVNLINNDLSSFYKSDNESDNEIDSDESSDQFLKEIILSYVWPYY